MRFLCLVLVLVLVGGAPIPAVGQDPGGPLALDEVFDQPFIFHQLSNVMVQGLQLGRVGRLEEMEKVLEGVVERVPGHPVPLYNLACAKARRGKTDEALDALDQAVIQGLDNPDQIAQDPDFARIRNHPRFDQILRKAAKVEPFSVAPPTPAPLKPVKGVAMIEESNTGWNPRTGALISLFEFDKEPPKAEEIVKSASPACDLVRQWYAEGTAAGNYGDLYDNRDRDHSNLKYGDFPLLTRIEYGPVAKARKLDWSLQNWFLYNAVTIGNASVAATQGPYWTSVARQAYVNPRSMSLLYAQYRANQLYVYPEHKDHDPATHGDVFPVNTPYMLISQGSSGSDKPFLSALAVTLAAFQPEVKQQLSAKGLLMPTLQMIFRRCNQQVQTAEDYLSGLAHPTVFDQKQISSLRMVKLAHAITPDALPPLAALKVIEETPARIGIDFFHNVPSEALCTTPHAIGRVVRSMAYERRMVVSAEPSLDVNGRSLTYHWAVLRGDADRIRINPLNESGSRVELLIPYHGRFPVTAGAKLESNRVDIGAFVHNGAHYSAPAFISLFYLDNEQREYDDAHRIRSVQYSGGATVGNYVDPQIDTPKDWRDEYQYDADGALAGWTRSMTDDQTFEFDAGGRVVITHDAEGRPALTRPAVYISVPGEDGLPMLVQRIAQPAEPIGPRIR